MSDNITNKSSGQKRRYYRRKPKVQPKTVQLSDTSITEETAATQKDRKPKSNRSNQKKQNTPMKTRNDELSKLQYKLVNQNELRLINSSNRSKIFKIQLSEKDVYQLTIPLNANQPLLLSNLITNQDDTYAKDARVTNNIIKNFNLKVKPNDKSCLFYLNYLINNHEFLKTDNLTYRNYEVNKLV